MMEGRAALLRGHHTRRRSSAALPIAPIVSGNWYQTAGKNRAPGGATLRVLWPDGNELIPLVYILSNLRLECTQDLPSQFPANLAIAQGLAVVGKFREHLHGVTGAPADNRHPDQRAARRPGQFRRRQRRFKRMAEQFHRHAALGRRAVERYRQGRPRLEPFDDLHKGETILADDQGLDAEATPRRDAKVGEAIVGFGLSEDCQRDAELVQQQAAMLPIAEVERDEKDA